MEIIKVIENHGQQIVSARELHEFLEIKTDFTDWCKRMFEYGFEENIDFTSILGKSTGGRPSIDYGLSLDCAKEISMLQRTDKGKQARKYFIEVEKKYKSMSIPKTFGEALRLAADQQLLIEKQQLLIEEAKPKVEFFDAVTDSKTAIDMGSVAKLIDLNIGRNKLFEFLRSNEILMDNNIPYQRFIDAGWFRVIEQKYQNGKGEICINIKTIVYQKGIQKIRELYLKKQ